MTLSVESLIIAIGFILPGFITTKMINARTPSLGKDESIFQETTESLLRSVYINLFIGLGLLLYLEFKILPASPELAASGLNEWLPKISEESPLVFLWLLLTWVSSTFILASLFGYLWDPLHFLLERLAKSTGTLTVDPLSLLMSIVEAKRDKGIGSAQLWAQAKMTDGSIYQGQLYFAGYKNNQNGREIILDHATYYPTADSDSHEQYDYAFINSANCIGIEFKIRQVE